MEEQNKISEEWAAILRMPGYEISRSGQVRNARNQRLRTLQTHPNNNDILWLGTPGAAVQINVALFETFGPGAATLAGMPEPDMSRVEKSRAVAAQKKKEQQPGCMGGLSPKRRCTDCGRPTSNYRCEKCWRKRRGYGADEAGDAPEILDKQAYSKAAKAATSRKAKPQKPFKPQEFKSLAWSPFFVDRQAEFLAQQENKMEALPRNPGDRPTFTIKQLAALSGVEYSSVRNIISGKTTSGKHFEYIKFILEERGATFTDVVKTPRGQGKALQKDVEAPNLGKIITEAFQALEPEAAELQAEPSGVETEKFDADVNQLIAAMNKSEAQGVQVISCDQAMPLDRLLCELKRLLPTGAKITIEF